MISEFSLKDKVAIVTGATGLLGREHCKALYESEAIVVVADIDQKACDAFAHDLGERAFGVAMNVTDAASLRKAKESILAKAGRIDILVNNAAINDKVEDPQLAVEQSAFETFPESRWRQMVDVNVTGVFLACQVLGTVMAEQGRGSIINVASTYGMVAPDQNLYKRPDGTQAFFKTAAYPTTKGAVLAFTRFLAAYWGKKGVRVNSLSPGGVEAGQDDYFRNKYSERTMLDRMAKPTDYRGALVFLASDASGYMTGSNLVVDGGWTAW